eukprot:CAMPEP_0119177248 /NCGR_PEP_ID=MMETSP1315-20130426/48113_1 /TAXON_ID=676789 /ORGANISM="Prasinoderma singularis, Strain RCC927" /LENGTH=70 /DNA_ID=CAMNT_0007171389 /DNA_START=149 /DNA_END=358 /DNA_ORIENTATION=+
MKSAKRSAYSQKVSQPGLPMLRSAWSSQDGSMSATAASTAMGATAAAMSTHTPTAPGHPATREAKPASMG